MNKLIGIALLTAAAGCSPQVNAVELTYEARYVAKQSAKAHFAEYQINGQLGVFDRCDPATAVDEGTVQCSGYVPVAPTRFIRKMVLCDYVVGGCK